MIGSDTIKVATVTATVTPRSVFLLSLGINSNSRTPNIGRNVVRLRRWLLMNSCSFIQSANNWLLKYVVAQHYNHTKRHRPCIVVNHSGLHVAENTTEPHDHTGNTIDNAINDNYIKALPEKLTECFTWIDKNEVIQFINVPFVIYST